jgi:hypothetical protein
MKRLFPASILACLFAIAAWGCTVTTVVSKPKPPATQAVECPGHCPCPACLCEGKCDRPECTCPKGDCCKLAEPEAPAGKPDPRFIFPKPAAPKKPMFQSAAPAPPPPMVSGRNENMPRPRNVPPAKKSCN